MMFTDRLDALLKRVGYIHGLNVRDDSFHFLLDKIDKAVGIRTRHGSAAAYHAGTVPFPQSEYVGARLARLERHVKTKNAPRYFWLGAGGG